MNKQIFEIFERQVKNNEIITFLFHTDSFIEAINKKDECVINFLILNLSKYIKIEATPTKDIAVKSILSEFKIKVPEYIKSKRKLGTKYIRTEPYTKYEHFICNNPPEETYIPDYGNILNYDILLFDSTDLDFFILNTNILKNFKNKTSFYINISDAIEFIRLIFLKNGIFEVYPGHNINEFLYYLIVTSKKLPVFQEAWSLSIETKNTTFNKLLQSLDTRFTFFLKTIDILLYITLGKPGINAHQRSIYYFAFLMVLTTGILDDFARLFCYEYNFTFKQKTRINLKVIMKKQKSYFTKEVSNYNKHLSNYLEDIFFKTYINIIYDLRDKVQHREYLYSGVLKEGFYILIDENLYDLFKSINKGKNEKIIYYDEYQKNYYIDVYIFINDLRNTFNSIIIDLFNFIDLSKYWSNIAIEKRTKIKKEIDRLTKFPWKRLQMFPKPILI